MRLNEFLTFLHKKLIILDFYRLKRSHASLEIPFIRLLKKSTFSNILFIFIQFIIQSCGKVCSILFCSITPTNLGRFSKPGSVLKSAGPDDFKTPPTCAI